MTWRLEYWYHKKTMARRVPQKGPLSSVIACILWFTGLTSFLFLIGVYLLISLVIAPHKVQWMLLYMSRVILLFCGQYIKIHGSLPVQGSGPYIYMFNHESLLDIFLICAVTPSPVTAIGAQKQFSMPIWGSVLRRYGAIPIDRGHLDPAIASLKTAEKALGSGTSLIISPEGTRTLTGKIGRFKKGPFHVALHTRATIIPIGLDGAYRANNKGDWRMYPGIIDIRMGEPIPAKDYENLSVDALRDMVKEKITRLAGQKS